MARKFKDGQIVLWKKQKKKGIVFGMHSGMYVVAFKEQELAKEKPDGCIENGWAVVGLSARELKLYRGML